MLNTFTAPEIIWRVPEAIQATSETVVETAASAWKQFRESVTAVLEHSPHHREAFCELTRDLRIRVLGPDPGINDDA